MPAPHTDPERWARIKELFAQAAALQPAARGAFLDTACRGDRKLRAEVESLLAAEAAAPAFLDQDAVAVASPVFAGDQPAPGGLAGRRISHYELESLLGAGGMGEVYRARDTALGRSVAVKVLPQRFRPEIRRRLLREAWATSRLQHPAIATFYDAGRAGGVDFIAMELVEGVTLRQRLAQGPLEPAAAVSLLERLLEGLAHAHEVSVLHRDIKPENVMLAAAGGIKLLDFGLAREASGPAADLPEPAGDSIPTDAPPGLTLAGTVLGTAGYMAPEQARAVPVDARADLFAVGAVLFEALTGRPAFDGDSTRARLDATLAGGAPTALPGDLGRVVHKALAADPADRYQDATEFLDDLHGAVGAEPRDSDAIRIAALGFDGEQDGPDSLLSELSSADRFVILPRHEVAMALGASPETQTLQFSPIEAGRRLGCHAVLRRLPLDESTGGGLLLKLHEATTGALLHHEPAADANDRQAAARLAVALRAAFPSADRGHPPDASGHREIRLFSRAQRLGLSSDRADLRLSRELALELVGRNPAHAAALTELGRVRAMSHNFSGDPDALDAAMGYLERAIAADPLLAEAYIWLGYSHLRAADYPTADRLLRRAARLDAANPQSWYFRAGLNLIVIQPADLAELAESAGAEPRRVDLHAWRRARARELLQRAIRLDPRYAWAWLSLGWCHLELESLDEARWCLERAVALESTVKLPTAGVSGYLGECLRRAGRQEEAREAFMTGLEALEDSDSMYRDTWRGLFLCGLGLTAAESGDRPAARSSFDQARQLLRGRHRARGGGQIMVQARAGLAAVDGDRTAFDDALRLFRDRRELDFGWVWGCSDDYSALALARAAAALGEAATAGSLLREAASLGSLEARRLLAQYQGVEL